MDAGTVAPQAGTTSRVLTGEQGLGSRLVFESAATTQTTDLGFSRPAFRCDDCGTVVLPDADSFRCFECETEILENAAACPKCGWTW